MASSACSFTRNTLHSTTISKECKGMVIDQLKAWLVEFGSCVGLRNCKTNSVCKPLTEGTSSNLDTRSILSFGVARGDAIYCLYCPIESAAIQGKIGTGSENTYSEGFEIVQGHSVTEEM